MWNPNIQPEQLFWVAKDFLEADGGQPYPTNLATDPAVQALAAVLLLRLIDFEDECNEAAILEEGREYHSFFPESLKWKQLVSGQGVFGWNELVSERLRNRVRYELVPFLEHHPEHGDPRLVCRHAVVQALSSISSPRGLALLFDLVDRLPFETPNDLQRAEKLLGNIVVQWAEKSGYNSEFSTPPVVAELMAAIVGPRLGALVYHLPVGNPEQAHNQRNVS